MEYYFGTNPGSHTEMASVANMQIQEFFPGNVRDLYLSMVYRKSQSVTDVIAVLEFSRDLDSWPEQPDVSLIESTEDMSNGVEEVVVRSPFPIFDSLESQFIRIRIK